MFGNIVFITQDQPLASNKVTTFNRLWPYMPVIKDELDPTEKYPACQTNIPNNMATHMDKYLSIERLRLYAEIDRQYRLSITPSP